MASKMACSDEGNFSIDFLMGVLLFVLTFAFVLTSIPGMFMPYQSTSIDLGSVVYRTSSILVEDPGWYKHGDTSYSNWELSDNVNYVTRVGLAIDKRSPNVLSMDKIRAMQDLSYITARDKMGLNNTVTYNFSLSLKELKSSGTSEILNFSTDYTSGIVESMDRIVHIREGEGILIDASQYYDPFNIPPSGPQNYAVINHNPSIYGNVSIRIENLNDIPAGTPDPINVTFYYDDAQDEADWGHFNQPANYLNHEYYIYKNGNYVDDTSDLSISGSDIIDVVIDANRIYYQYFSSVPSLNLSSLRVNTASTTSCFPNTTIYYDTTNTLYHYYDTDGIMTLKVWQI